MRPFKILSLEWKEESTLQIIGSAPDWAKNEFECFSHLSDARGGVVLAESFSPFLENFIYDAQDFWQKHSSQLLRSGIWTEVGLSQQEIHLEATALYLDSRRIIIVESSEAAVNEKFQWLQTARQEQLEFIDERKVSASRILSATSYDSLTGLPNRSLFLSQLETVFEASKGLGQRQFAVIMLNLDRFQQINNSLGADAGDRVLITVASRIRTCLRKHDMPVRFGADEFGILAENIDQIQDVTTLVERLLESINQPFIINGYKTYFTASAGIATSEVRYSKASDLLHDAGLAMQQSKSLGRGRCTVFNRQMRARAFELWSLESALDTAIEKSELHLYYQPIIDLKTNKIERFEALIRWQHPQHGWISPAKFIPLAEESGHILAIDIWVLNTACQAIRQWQQATGKAAYLNINIAPQHFVEGNLFEAVQQAIASAQISPSVLCLEIIESFLLTDTEVAIATLRRLKSLGVQIAIDDFGTGYASLGYLQDLPLDKLKIDGYFIEMMEESGPDIVSTIIDLAHKLKLSVTSERVETALQYNMLQQLGCDTAQGYLFAKAMPAIDAQSFIDTEVIISNITAAKFQPMSVGSITS